MIDIISLIISSIITFVILIIVFVCDMYGERWKFAGGFTNDLYHGSNKKLTELKPHDSLLTDQPAVFATSSYLDAVIFSAQWTDFDFQMWGTNTRHLDEQYPGAFDKLNVTGYIHHVSGQNFKPLKTAGSNSRKTTEFISTNTIRPTIVDTVNVLEYIKSQKNIILREFADVVAAQKNATPHKMTADVVCFISADDFAPAIMDQLYEIEKLNTKYKIEFSDKIDMNHLGQGKKHRDKRYNFKYILLGPDILGNIQYLSKNNIPKYYLQQDQKTLMDNFNNAKTTKTEFKKYLTARKKLFNNWQPITIDELNKILLVK